MSEEISTRWALTYIILVMLLFMGGCSWSVYREYQNYQVRKAIIELAEKQHKP